MFCLGTMAKGRSSSFKLNGVLRSLVGYLLVSDLELVLLSIASGMSPADALSRFQLKKLLKRLHPGCVKTGGRICRMSWRLRFLAALEFLQHHV